MSESVVTAVADRVATIRLNRPAARNALDAASLALLAGILRDIASDDAVDVVVLTGTDPAFCAGLDLNELAVDPGRLMSVAIGDATNPWRALRAVPQPVIGAVNGPAFTGGLELALACDFVIASTRASFADTHAKVGVLPAQGLPSALAAAVGVPMAKLLSLTGRPVDADEAYRLGLVVDVVPHDRLMEAAETLARDVCAGQSAAVRAVKRQYDEGLMGTRSDWWRREREEAVAWSFGADLPDRAIAVRGTSARPRD